MKKKGLRERKKDTKNNIEKRKKMEGKGKKKGFSRKIVDLGK